MARTDPRALLVQLLALEKRVNRIIAGSTPGPHASTHEDGGSDPIDITDLDGFPGGTTTFLRADGSFASVSAAGDGTCGITIDGGGAVITTGIKGDLHIPVACTITVATMLADQSGSAVVDIWKDSYANYPPTDADSITASAPPTISSAVKSQDSSLSGWTVSLSAGDTLRFNVDSCTSITRLQLQLTVTF